MARNENENLSGLDIPDTDDIITVFIGRSEERRVGKEC